MEKLSRRRWWIGDTQEKIVHRWEVINVYLLRASEDKSDKKRENRYRDALLSITFLFVTLNSIQMKRDW